MTQFLSKLLGRHMNRANLLKLAAFVAEVRQVKVDRLAKRTKEILIVWFCENALDLIQDPSSPLLRAAVAELQSTTLEGTEDPPPPPPKLKPFPSLAEMGLLDPLRPDPIRWPHLPGP
jgi:hypothetical protein